MDVAEETQGTGCNSCGDLAQKLLDLHVKVDELLADSRRARPVLDRYLKLTNPGWLRSKRDV
jgi:hypothetical protein